MKHTDTRKFNTREVHAVREAYKAFVKANGDIAIEMCVDGSCHRVNKDVHNFFRFSTGSYAFELMPSRDVRRGNTCDIAVRDYGNRRELVYYKDIACNAATIGEVFNRVAGLLKTLTLLRRDSTSSELII